jgi:hypothetical protein
MKKILLTSLVLLTCTTIVRARTIDEIASDSETAPSKHLNEVLTDFNKDVKKAIGNSKNQKIIKDETGCDLYDSQEIQISTKEYKKIQITSIQTDQIPTYALQNAWSDFSDKVHSKGYYDCPGATDSLTSYRSLNHTQVVHISGNCYKNVLKNKKLSSEERIQNVCGQVKNCSKTIVYGKDGVDIETLSKILIMADEQYKCAEYESDKN